MNFDEFKEKYERKKVQEYPNNARNNPLVSVIILTYQQKEYIKDCLEGILMQKTNFPFEIIIGEDDSHDGTREICIEYAKKYPDIIRLILQHRENNMKLGEVPTLRFNLMYAIYSTRGKYIALCGGDDYWTDFRKLQKQFDILETRSDLAMCTHEMHHRILDRDYRPDLKRIFSIFVRDFQVYGLKCIPVLGKEFLFDRERFWLRKRTADQHRRKKINYLQDLKNGTWYMPGSSEFGKREIFLQLCVVMEKSIGDHQTALILAAMAGGIYHIPDIMGVKQDQKLSVSKSSARRDLLRKLDKSIETSNRIKRYRGLKKFADPAQAQILDEMIAEYTAKHISSN
ncbi:MAG TPA: glycosyltransferase family 2 protein [Aequorivita sp.]|nr:glycosyltransferase family 2 protein [Aequorivita sp.]